MDHFFPGSPNDASEHYRIATAQASVINELINQTNATSNFSCCRTHLLLSLFVLARILSEEKDGEALEEMLRFVRKDYRLLIEPFVTKVELGPGTTIH